MELSEALRTIDATAWFFSLYVWWIQKNAIKPNKNQINLNF